MARTTTGKTSARKTASKSGASSGPATGAGARGKSATKTAPAPRTAAATPKPARTTTRKAAADSTMASPPPADLGPDTAPALASAAAPVAEMPAPLVGAARTHDQDGTSGPDDSTGRLRAAPTIKLKELVERVVQRSGKKKKDAKPVIEATLAILGEALARGEDLNLPGLGKAHVSRTKDVGGADALVVKVRRSTREAGPDPVPDPDDAPTETLAVAGE